MLKWFKKIYLHPWCPRFFFKKCDGGPTSGVTGYMLIEFKPLFSIGLLHFKNGSRESYHSHAFWACTWWLRGFIIEQHYPLRNIKYFWPSLVPKITKRDCFHKVTSKGDSWALTFRGPWSATWQEARPSENGPVIVTLTHGRKEVNENY